MKSWLGGSLVAVLLSLSACTTAGKMPHDMTSMIQSATTRADHEALATHYEQEAKTLQAKASEHRDQAKAYEKSAGYPRGKGGLIQHCELLASQYQEAAKENLELAKQHRALAEEAPK